MALYLKTMLYPYNAVPMIRIVRPPDTDPSFYSEKHDISALRRLYLKTNLYVTFIKSSDVVRIAHMLTNDPLC